MIENVQSSLYVPVISEFFNTSVFFPRRTSRILLIGTVLLTNEKKEKKKKV